MPGHEPTITHVQSPQLMLCASPGNKDFTSYGRGTKNYKRQISIISNKPAKKLYIVRRGLLSHTAYIKLFIRISNSWLRMSFGNLFLLSEYFLDLRPQTPHIDVSELHKACRSTDFEVLILWNAVRSEVRIPNHAHKTSLFVTAEFRWSAILVSKKIWTDS